jgi:choline-sulfatase
VLTWPGIEPGVYAGLHYHLDIGATVVELAGLGVPDHWDGVSVADELRSGGEAGRDHLVLSQGAWACQRGVRVGDDMYLRTWHDGYHGHWGDEMLFDLAADRHEQNDLAPSEQPRVEAARGLLDTWTGEQLERSYSPVDPMDIVRQEGGPYHTRRHLPDYLTRLRDTGRAQWAEVLVERHASEADPERWDPGGGLSAVADILS